MFQFICWLQVQWVHVPVAMRHKFHLFISLWLLFKCHKMINKKHTWTQIKIIYLLPRTALKGQGRWSADGFLESSRYMESTQMMAFSTKYMMLMGQNNLVQRYSLQRLKHTHIHLLYYTLPTHKPNPDLSIEKEHFSSFYSSDFLKYKLH